MHRDLGKRLSCLLDIQIEAKILKPQNIPTLVALREGRAPIIYGDGRQTRDFTYVANVIEANRLACTAGEEALDRLQVALASRFDQGGGRLAFRGRVRRCAA